MSSASPTMRAGKRLQHQARLPLRHQRHYAWQRPTADGHRQQRRLIVAVVE